MNAYYFKLRKQGDSCHMEVYQGDKLLVTSLVPYDQDSIQKELETWLVTKG